MPLTRRTISESTVDELIKIVSEVALGVVSEVLEEYLEDILAMSNPDYMGSIEKARREYEKGEYVSLKEIEDGL